MHQAESDLHPTHARISLSAFRHNLDVVRSYVGPDVQIMAVVKANAYGHGVIPIVSEAIAWGVSHFAVARIGEGLELRRAGVRQHILVFEVPTPSQIPAAIENGLQLTVVDASSLSAIESAAARLKTAVEIHCKVDTGMGRLGFPVENAVEGVRLINNSKHLKLAGVYSHFATSDEQDSAFAEMQIDRFKKVIDGLRADRIEIPLVHMANSGAIISLPESHFDMVRPGIMLYGYHPRPDAVTSPPLVPVMSLHSRVSQLKCVQSGTSISYNRRYTTSGETHIATVPIGYADGYNRALTNKGEAIISGHRFPVVGTVCMDHIMIDVGPEPLVEVGDEVILIGRNAEEQISAWDIGLRVGTIPYEVTCAISTRVQRLHEA